METGSDALRRAEVTELIAVRIRHFGGVVRELAPGASLDRDDMRLVCCRTASRLAYLAYVIRGLLGASWTIPGHRSGLQHASRLPVQRALDRIAGPAREDSADRERKIYIEADGELLGTLPAEITVVPNALTLLAPPR